MSFHRFPVDAQRLFVYLRMLPEPDTSSKHIQFRVNRAAVHRRYDQPPDSTDSIASPQAELGMSEWDLRKMDIVTADNFNASILGYDLLVSQCGFVITVQRLPEYYRNNVVMPVSVCL
jgi:hypothetical protein